MGRFLFHIPIRVKDRCRPNIIDFYFSNFYSEFVSFPSILHLGIYL